MRKVLRILSIAVLTCFITTTLGLGNNVIKTKITLTPVSPIFYENYVGIETPTLNQEFKLHVETRYNDEIVMDVRIKDPGAFKIKGEPEIEYEEDKPKANAFTFQAPDKEGTYKIIFEGTTDALENFDFDTEIKVVESDSFQMWVRVGSIVGITVVAVAVILLISNAGK